MFPWNDPSSHSLHVQSAGSPYEPASQSTSLIDPAGQLRPGVQAMHCDCAASGWCVPTSHGSSFDAPSEQLVPALQSMHAVLLASGWCFPDGHNKHPWLPSSGAKLPAEHGVGAALPVGLKKPGAVNVHSAALVRLDELEYDPPGQGAGSTEPSTQNEPAMQSRQPTCPESGWRLPGSQRAHVALPLLGAALPGRQSWQTSAVLLPGMGLALPGGQARQDAWLALPVDGLYVPGWHGVYVWRTVAAPSAAQ